jgi:signal transduction histidine kinase
VIAAPEPRTAGLASFRTKLLVAMMLVVSAVTTIALFYAQRNVADNVRRDLQREFKGELAALHAVQEIRHAALAERCRALARKPRIHAALEDNARDLLYPSARDELVDIMIGDDPDAGEAPYAFHARFYRFLDAAGMVIPPPDVRDVGPLKPGEEVQLTLPAAPGISQTGYLWRQADGGGEMIDEVIAMPVVSTETREVVAALVLGFKPVDLRDAGADAGIRNGIWLKGRLHLPALAEYARAMLAAELARSTAAADRTESSFTVEVDGAPSLLFYKLLNPGSLFPPAYEVCIYPLTESIARQRRLVWQFAGAGVLLLLGAFVLSRFLSARLSRPVEKLEVDSEVNRNERRRAEAALGLTHEELQRSARFSADASHQLKTPVTVLRAGLEELLAEEKLSPGVREEVSALVHQTFRLTNVIEDLLLLSRMDAGRLHLEFSPVNLTQLLEALLDDLGALPDVLDLRVETDIPPGLSIAGERRYTSLILQNLLENARKYNVPGGRIRMTAREEGSWCVLTIGNTGRPIAVPAQEHIFERFHRGTAGENVPGHGLGLNLARELARLHRGDLRLMCSDEQWTEFEVRFRLAGPAVEPGGESS